jgi:tripartite-type tricarboxylate transporter receptor subunit TctC
MKFPRRQFLHLAAGAVALPAVSRIAQAQVYPSRPITIVVPFPAGGSTDVIGRILAENMRASLGQTIIIENVGPPVVALASGASRGQRRTATLWTSANGTLMSRTVQPIRCPTICRTILSPSR